jgi:hypothetical protein
MIGFCFNVVSSSHSVEHVQASILEFARNIPTFISTLPAASFDAGRRALLASVLEPATSLHEAATVFWAEIEDRRLDFTAKQQQAALLRGTKPEGPAVETDATGNGMGTGPGKVPGLDASADSGSLAGNSTAGFGSWGKTGPAFGSRFSVISQDSLAGFAREMFVERVKLMLVQISQSGELARPSSLEGVSSFECFDMSQSGSLSKLRSFIMNK